MAFQESTRFCKICNKQVLVRRKGTNHILHLILSFLTAGFWIPIWILLSIKIGGWRCSQCGCKISILVLLLCFSTFLFPINAVADKPNNKSETVQMTCLGLNFMLVKDCEKFQPALFSKMKKAMLNKNKSEQNNAYNGIAVMNVMAGSIAEEIGIRQYDILSRVNGRRIDSIKQLQNSFLSKDKELKLSLYPLNSQNETYGSLSLKTIKDPQSLIIEIPKNLEKYATFELLNRFRQNKTSFDDITKELTTLQKEESERVKKSGGIEWQHFYFSKFKNYTIDMQECFFNICLSNKGKKEIHTITVKVELFLPNRNEPIKWRDWTETNEHNFEINVKPDDTFEGASRLNMIATRNIPSHDDVYLKFSLISVEYIDGSVFKVNNPEWIREIKKQ